VYPQNQKKSFWVTHITQQNHKRIRTRHTLIKITIHPDVGVGPQKQQQLDNKINLLIITEPHPRRSVSYKQHKLPTKIQKITNTLSPLY
ncbi:hypothetical protein ACVGXP_15680, partial [Enterobacter hormaechei]